MINNSSIWGEILEEARYAPSPHNVQPWKLRVISEHEATLSYDPTRLLPDEDIKGSYTLAGFGIFLECVALVALDCGYKLEYVYNGVLLDRYAVGIQPLFHLTLTTTNAIPDIPVRFIRERRTSRIPYNDRPLSEDAVNELIRIAGKYGYDYTISQEPGLVKWILNLNCETLFYDMEDDLTRNEVAAWVRYTKKEAEAKNDGLAAFCLNVPGAFLRIFFRNHRLLNLPMVKPGLKAYYLRTMRGTTTVGWICGPFATPADWLNAGHMLARLWLKMTEHGIYLHPFGSTITNPKAHAQLKEKFSVDESVNPLWLIMRLGHSDLPPRSARLEVTDIIHD